MRILSVGTALPPHRHTQDELLDELGRAWAGRPPEDLKRLRRLSGSTMVRERYLSMPPRDYLDKPGFTDRMRVYRECGVELAEIAVKKALEEAGLTPRDVDLLFFTTVTGVSVPTLDAMLLNRLDFRSDIKRIPCFGLGCVAGAAGTARLLDYLNGAPDKVALLVSVELCSLTFQLDDTSISNLVGVNLFGDGASALVAVGKEHPSAKHSSGPEVLASRSRFYPKSEHIMGWDVGSHGFRIVLDPGVPDIVEAHLRKDLEEFLRSQKLSLEAMTSWVSHPGGPKVLQAIQKSLQLTEADLALSWQQLANTGNLSSSSVLFILRETMHHRRPPADSLGMMMAMGPGFCAEMLLLKW